ncbi:hypothetical protein HDG40_000749 [Paraburkholderia sp. JPY158]|uniref:Uncharacterized protein n=1 Tax=Paraburkholderia atlantica TaxID=2654982 RepID=A0A7W8Q2L3_PARAM|nr:hypothetical protein [Paraburkholderia atlantica]
MIQSEKLRMLKPVARKLSVGFNVRRGDMGLECGIVRPPLNDDEAPPVVPILMQIVLQGAGLIANRIDEPLERCLQTLFASGLGD